MKKEFTFSFTIRVGLIASFLDFISLAIRAPACAFRKFCDDYCIEVKHTRDFLGQFYTVVIMAIVAWLVWLIWRDAKIAWLFGILAGLSLSFISTLSLTVVSWVMLCCPPTLGSPTGANISTWVTRCQIVDGICQAAIGSIITTIGWAIMFAWVIWSFSTGIFLVSGITVLIVGIIYSLAVFTFNDMWICYRVWPEFVETAIAS